MDTRSAIQHSSRNLRVRGTASFEELARYDVKMNGVDRIDPRGDYTPSNIVPCCWVCNRMKGVIPQDKFLHKCQLNTVSRHNRIVQSYSITDLNPFQQSCVYHQHGRHVRNCKSRSQVPMLQDVWWKIVSQACHYCGEMDIRTLPPSAMKRVSGWQPRSVEASAVPLNGIDRIDSSIDYVAGNVVPCCGNCNYMKGTLTKGEFIRATRQITSKQLLDRLTIAIIPDQAAIAHVDTVLMQTGAKLQ